MNRIAIFYGDTTIYFSSILIAIALIAALLFSLAIYVPNHRYHVAIWLYFPLATCASIIISRALHFNCNREQYVDFKSALSDYTTGDYCISGVILGTLIVALVLAALRIVKNPYEILNAIAPGLAFVITIIRFSHIYSDKCYGKMIIENDALKHLPLAAPLIGSDGNLEYRFASFFISFLLMLAITIFLVIASFKSNSQLFNLFLLLFSAEEVFIDSTRYDASHLFFSGEQFAELNKGASFMGLSQIVSAVTLLVLFIYYLISSIRSSSRNHFSKKYLFAAVPLFVLGLAAGGVCEYLVQRFTGLYMYIYPGMIAGLVCIIISIRIMARVNVMSENVTS